MPANRTYNDKELLLRTSAGEERAFEELVVFYRPHLLSYITTFTKSVERAEEVVQDVFLHTWLARESLKDIRDFRSFLFSISKNLALNAVRSVLRERSRNNKWVWPGETEVAAAFKRLLQADLPKIGFVTGSLERDIEKMGDKDYKTITNLSTFRYALVNQGFDVLPISLESDSIPADIATLVLADPKIELSAEALAALQAYIDQGGNVLIAGEPGRQAILNPIIQQFGTQFMPGTILQESKDFAPNLAVLDLTEVAGSFTKSVEKSRKDSVKVTMPGAMGIAYEPNGGYEAKPLLMTDAALSWNRVKPIDLELITKAASGGGGSSVVSSSGGMVISMSVVSSSSSSSEDKAAKKKELGTVKFEASDGDVRGPLPTALALSRTVNGKEQRIVVLGDADLMSNAELGRYNIQTANFDFNTSLFSWLSYGEFPVDTSRSDARDKRVRVTPDDVDILRIIYIWVLPAILLACGAVLLVRRKRK